MASNSTAVIVPAPDQAATNALGPDIRDIKGPVDIPTGWAWLWWTLAAIALLVVLYYAWKALQRHLNRPIPIPTIPAHERARRKLQEALDYFDRPKEFCVLVSDAIRLYLEERFEFRAPERTTEEFLAEIRESAVLAPRQKQSLADFLARCDMVKFAKYTPGQPELQDLYDAAFRLLAETAPPDASLRTAPKPESRTPVAA
ncbi:MAG: hypothetical protein AB1705_03150 [Verrucomicrobiota bacterium]